MSAFCAVLVAAGQGTRFGMSKQFVSLAGKPVLRWSAEALLRAGAAPLLVVVAPGQEETCQTALQGLEGYRVVAGGPSRHDSVRSGLAALGADAPDLVLIHDAARPLLDAPVIEAVLGALEAAPAALPALPLTDTIKRAADGRVIETVPRDQLWRAQTPQGFHRHALMTALAAWSGDDPSDEVRVMEDAGHAVALVPGSARLLKLTHQEDLAMAEALVPRITLTGQGLDAHRWGPGESVWLCGVEIDHHQSLIGHSDADAGLHALTDAILGALGDGDIGDHFPPTDPRWKGAASDQFLVHALERLRARGGALVNVDVTLVCEQPRIKPHRAAMRQRLSELLGLDLARVSVKATTMEGMGFTGRGEGLFAQAIATITLPA
ncbi:MAG: bifunctional 2-C-methyl-D-erythritol 4-phosphate cytidylyltransferase/2-C-methyl-D-erythritol 2,4-cyclodiphosphate synthase [Brevundimonas sp.]|jgi:2-C-methyl-D-erythritol 4-phosphate cytidylyltransferase / 2-C-methyl-D-erythritol 2,4-cyclodiphosphate synthase|uniref:bifunctional 2-C-methyl-D-erythritol 4-phosphate cytidylyltransferase/2-C-methyl-D-erythritol 2,4-cyclodiphosphate synthase n=1 Tax=Brevundimonas sp. TaxID=1871086 RepID=UPI003918D8FA